MSLESSSFLPRFASWRRVITRASPMLAAWVFGPRQSQPQWVSASSRGKGHSLEKVLFRIIAVVPEMQSSNTKVARTSRGCMAGFPRGGSGGSRRCITTSPFFPCTALSALRQPSGLRVRHSSPIRMTLQPKYSAGPSTIRTSCFFCWSVICSRFLEVWLPWSSRQTTATIRPSSFSATFSTVQTRVSVQNSRVRPPTTEIVGYCSMYRSCFTMRSGSARSSASMRATKSPLHCGQPSQSDPATPICWALSMMRMCGRVSAKPLMIFRVASSEASLTRTTS
mmetsp:Transcript_52815/g.113097  ORF Transcript_52815/g.113097 Transcript_52815/m.113097 type:complete len:281 (+) Transcript_52815:417-1259(+)